jgi:hypothetical protein
VIADRASDAFFLCSGSLPSYQREIYYGQGRKQHSPTIRIKVVTIAQFSSAGPYSLRPRSYRHERCEVVRAPGVAACGPRPTTAVPRAIDSTFCPHLLDGSIDRQTGCRSGSKWFLVRFFLSKATGPLGIWRGRALRSWLPFAPAPHRRPNIQVDAKSVLIWLPQDVEFGARWPRPCTHSGEFISQITLPIRCVTNLRNV